jgi:RND family efflux transporter MFP subunit
MSMTQRLSQIAVLLTLITIAACGSNDEQPRGNSSRQGGPPGMMGGGMGGRPSAAVPVQVQPVMRRSISQYLETNGTLEAENEVDIVARTSGPVTEILTEEGRMVTSGQLMAKIDEREAANQVAIATVARDEAQLAFDRAKSSWEDGLVSREAYDTALSQLNSATAQLESDEIQLAYTRIRAPFDALVVTRDIRQAQYVTPGDTLFRISDFTPLLCRVEVPEKDLPRITIGQPAHLRVEAYPGERFAATVARTRPTVDASTGTFTVTLEVDGQGRLRPGMFASVFLRTETRNNVLVIPRDALVLDSLGDTVFIKDGDVAERREVVLGIRDEDSIEIEAGLEEGDLLIVVGQDGLADGTPVSVLGATAQERSADRSTGTAPEAQAESRGGAADDGDGSGRGMGPPPGGGIPPRMAERIKNASPEELERIKERMKQFGLSDERIDEIIKQVRGDGGAAN